jgi:hypothetical protein
MQSFNVLKEVVHIVTTGVKRVNMFTGNLFERVIIIVAIMPSIVFFSQRVWEVKLFSKFKFDGRHTRVIVLVTEVEGVRQVQGIVNRNMSWASRLFLQRGSVSR